MWGLRGTKVIIISDTPLNVHQSEDDRERERERGREGGREGGKKREKDGEKKSQRATGRKRGLERGERDAKGRKRTGEKLCFYFFSFMMTSLFKMDGTEKVYLTMRMMKWERSIDACVCVRACEFII